MTRTRLFLLLLALLLLTGCDQLFPYEKARYQECQAPDTSWAHRMTDPTDSIPIVVQVCIDRYQQADQ